MLYVGSRHCRPVHHRPELSRRSKLHDEQIDAHLLLDVAVAAAACRDVAILASSCFALSATAVAVSASALPVSLSGAECVFTASAGGSECDTASSTTGRAECDGVSASSSARESVAADNAFRLVLDASPDGLPVLVWQRVPRCE